MKKSALLALVVLSAIFPFPNAHFAEGAAPQPPAVFYLASNITAPHNLSAGIPVANGTVILGKNESAAFVLGNYSALNNTFADFSLQITLVSLNVSGLEVNFTLELDCDGSGSPDCTVYFRRHITAISKTPENVTVSKDRIAGGLLTLFHGKLTLTVRRSDLSSGLLEIRCGRDNNASVLSIPYAGPVQANAGPDITVRPGSPVVLNGSASRTVDLAQTAYIWDFDYSDGLGSDATGKSVTGSFNRTGTFNVSLRVRWMGMEDIDFAQITVTGNLPPAVDAGLNITTQRAFKTISFHGSAADPDGTVVSYLWTFGDGNSSPGQNATHAYERPGNYTVRLTAGDNEGASAFDELRVHINHPPNLSINLSRLSGRQVTMRAYATDPDDTVLGYEWDFGDGGTGSGVSPSHTYTTPGDFTVRCEVSDSVGENTTAYYTVSLSNAPPIIVSIGGPSTATAGEYVYFYPTVSDPDQDRLTYAWDFGDGTTSTERTPVHSFKKAGPATVTLDVSDGHTTVRETKHLTVNEAVNPFNLPSYIWLAMGAIVGAVVIVLVLLMVFVRRSGLGKGEYRMYGDEETMKTILPAAPDYSRPQYIPRRTAPSRPPRAPRPPPGISSACPRCGSASVQVYGDGHAKCPSCGKIMYR